MLFSNDNPYGDPYVGDHRNTQRQYERMRLAVIGGYDKVWIVESDMVVPEDALEMLLAVDAPVVSGVYKLRHGGNHPNLSDENGNVLSWSSLKGKDVMEAGGTAMGCVLLDRKVFDGFSFLVGGHAAPDGDFMKHLRKQGFKQIARLDVECGHISPSGEILWPELD